MISMISFIKCPVFLFLALFIVGCATKEPPSSVGEKLKPPAPTKTSSQKKAAAPVVTEEKTISIQRSVETVPFAAPDVDF